MVYRLLFLLFAEARGLVPLWNAIYRASYSIEALCEGSSGLVSLGESGRGYRRSLDSPMTDVARASSSARRLTADSFRPHTLHFSRTPESMTGRPPQRFAHCRPDRHVRPAANALSFVDLGVEQLGTVYEHILDYDAQLGHPRSARRVTLRSGRGRRKATGTFYTPRPLTDFLIRRTLHPLVEHASPEAILRLRILDPAMGSGAFLVAACRYLATAYESSLVQRGDLSAGDLNALDRAGFRRTIAQRCLFGVDRNPMAVQLGRFSLWLTTLASDRPLTFLDHHLRVGTVWWARRSTIWRGSPLVSRDDEAPSRNCRCSKLMPWSMRCEKRSGRGLASRMSLETP